jgi:hypothetical protein
MEVFMKFENFLNELSSNYGKGITFIDIDETLFRTFAMIYVLDKETGQIKKKLTNQEFNTYKLKDDEDFDFREFRSAKIFANTSIPINKTINRVKRMMQNLDERGSKIILLTARADFDDKETFLQTFKRYGLPIDKMYVERVGNFIERSEIYKHIIKKSGMPKSIAEMKEKVILSYIESGQYRRVRLIDDDMKNIKTFVKFGKEFPKKYPNVIEKIKEINNIPEDENFPVIQFFGLLVQENGSLKLVE